MSDKDKPPEGEPKLELNAEGLLELNGSVKEALEYMKSKDAKYEERAKAQEEATGKLEKAQEKYDKRITELKEYMEVEHGKSGLEDIRDMTGRWIKGASMAARGLAVPDDCKHPNISFEPDPSSPASIGMEPVKFGPTLLEKTTSTTTTDATAGYLVPDILMGEIQVGREIYGPLLSRARRIPVPAGVTILVNSRTTNPSVYWRNAQGTDISAESNPIYGQGSALPILIGAYSPVANELWNLPGTGFQADLLDGIVEAITKKEEQGIVFGDDDALGTDVDPPSDGFTTSTAGASDQTNLSAATLPVLTNFIGESVADYPMLTQTSGTFLALSPVKKWALAASAVGTAAANQLAWGDGITAPPPSVEGFQLIESQAMQDGSSVQWASLLRPQEDIFYCNSGSMSVAFNPWLSSAFLGNETWVRVITHTDWVFPIAAHISIADFD